MDVETLNKPELHTSWRHRLEGYRIDVTYITQQDMVICVNPDGVAFDIHVDKFHEQFEPDKIPSWMGVPKQEKCWECCGAGERQMSMGMGYDRCLTCRGTGYLPSGWTTAKLPGQYDGIFHRVAAEVEAEDRSIPKVLAYGSYVLYFGTLICGAVYLALPLIQDLSAWLSAALR